MSAARLSGSVPCRVVQPTEEVEAIRLEHRLRGRPVLPDPRWS